MELYMALSTKNICVPLWLTNNVYTLKYWVWLMNVYTLVNTNILSTIKCNRINFTLWKIFKI